MTDLDAVRQRIAELLNEQHRDQETQLRAELQELEPMDPIAWMPAPSFVLPPDTPLHFVPYPAVPEYIEGGFDTQPPNAQDEQE